MSMKISVGVVLVLGLVLQALAQDQIFCVINTGSCLRIRATASVSGQSLICVRDGTKLEDLNAQITAEGIIWRNVRYQSHVGWTSKQYLKSCGTVPSTPLPNLNEGRPLTLLPLPTQRPVRQFYGDTRVARASNTQYRSSQGMNPWLEFVADENNVVIASCEGQVVFAGDNSPFAAGRGVIVRCGPWYVIYGRLKSVSVQRGDQALLGQIIGRAGKEGLPLQIRPVPSSLIAEKSINNHPGDTITAVNPLTVFSVQWNSYFNSEFNRLGGKQQFCTGDLMEPTKACAICDVRFISRGNAQFCDACLAISTDQGRLSSMKSTTVATTAISSPPNIDVLLKKIKNQKASVFSLDDLPPALTNWDYFISTLSAYRNATGVALKFVRFDNNVWHKVFHEVPMTVDQWYNWYINCRNKNEAIYLVGINVLAKDLLALRKIEAISSFTFGGTYCLSRYSDEPNILTGNLLINIAPPWGQVMVFPQLAGHGACASILCQTMGPKTTIKFDYWHRFDAGEQRDFEDIAKAAYNEVQLLQPGTAYKIDNSNEWDTLISMRLRALGIRSETHEIKLGQAILLPSSQYYSYKFYHHNSTDNNTTPCMILSAFGDFMGDDEQSFDYNFWSLYRLRRQVVEIVEAMIKILFGALAEFKYKPNDSICKEHAKAALGILKELILRQDLRNITWNHQLFREVQQMLQVNSNSSNDNVPQQTNQHVIWLDPPNNDNSVNGNKRKRDESEISNAEDPDPPAKRKSVYSTGDDIKFSDNRKSVNRNEVSEEEELIDLNS